MNYICIIIFISILFSCSNNQVNIVISDDADKIEKFAASELQKYLSETYPNNDFKVSNKVKGDKTIYLGIKEHLLNDITRDLSISPNQEGFVVSHFADKSGIITSLSSKGVLRGVYSLVETLGYAFVFNGDIRPVAKDRFDFKQWDLSDEPLVSERTVLNWHNFLSGCTGWDLEDWNLWTAQSQKMGYNMIMVHAYANNPIYTFQFNGITKPVGFLTSSVKGRDWSTEHVNDVRRLPGGYLFDGPIFGSEAAKVPDQQKVEKSQELMKKVFQHAEDRGVNVNIALDFDIVAAIPQEMVKSLPEEDRFLIQHKGIDWMGEKAGPVWIPRPDKPTGYSYYKTQVKTILELYPQIDILTLWKRAYSSVWVALEKEQLPKEWREEYLQYLKEKPEIGKMGQSVGSFAQAKLVKAYRKAIDELGREDVRLSFGTWRWDFLKSMNEFYPPDVSVYILDSEIIRGEKHLHNKEMIDEIAGWIKNGRVIPVIWPHHDDGAYIGSPLKEFSNLHNLLSQLKADGFGVIHWMTRPFDSFFIHHLKQVQRSTVNQQLDKTFTFLAEKWFGKQNAPIMSEYLIQWDKDMPTFGRETGPAFIDRIHYFKFDNVDSTVNQSMERIQLLGQVDVSELSKTQFQLYKYFLNYEVFVRDFYIEQDKYLKAITYLDLDEVAEAKKIIKSFQPEKVLQQYAKAIESGSATKGEKGLLFSMGVRWLPHFISLKQIVGLENICVNFGQTSHEEIAQLPGTKTYYIDSDQNFWLVFGEKETKCPVVKLNIEKSKYPDIFKEGISIESPTILKLKAYTLNKKLSSGKYKLKILSTSEKIEETTAAIGVNGQTNTLTISGASIYETTLELLEKDILEIKVNPVKGTVIICGMILVPKR